MDQKLLIESAHKFLIVLLKYSQTDSEANSLLHSLSNLIDDATNGRIKTPMEWRDVPGGHYFTEGNLGKYSDLETAYSIFKIEITGGESQTLKNLILIISSE